MEETISHGRSAVSKVEPLKFGQHTQGDKSCPFLSQDQNQVRGTEILPLCLVPQIHAFLFEFMGQVQVTPLKLKGCME